MNLKDIFYVATLTVVTAVFIGCSDGGSDAHFSDAEQKIQIIDCNDTNVTTIPDDFTTMVSNDTIIKNVTPTVITTYHDINGIKKVCVDTGSAYLLRK